MKANTLTVLILGGFLMFSGASAQAWQEPPYLMLARAELSMDQAVAQVKRSTGGRVISSRRDQRGGKKVYVIRVLLPGGRVKDVVVNAGGGK